jgi:ketopantoate reductase
MRVAVVGAGALGSVYGARLACLSGCDVEVVARAPGPERVTRLECVHDETTLEWAPARSERVSADTQVVVVCVRYEYLDSVVDRVEGSAAPVVVMTPMMPQDAERLSAAMPGRLVVAMPSVTAYENAAHAIRYWLPHGSTTLVESTLPGPGPVLAKLVADLEKAGISAKLERNVLDRSVATTMAILPLAMAVDLAGGIDAVLADHALLSLARDAAEEGSRLGATVGKAERWASMLPRFIGPRMLKAAAAVTRSRFPETLTYVEHHFAGKLRAQNLLLGARILELAKQRGARCDALERLIGRLVVT